MNITKNRIFNEIINYLPKIEKNEVVNEIISGLLASPKYISPKFFYNKKGSQLFEQITELDEYYPTRTEKQIISIIQNELSLSYSNLNIIELGSGDPSKIRLLFNQIPKEQLSSIVYYPVDISKYAIESSIEELSKEFPSIKIKGIVADFIYQLDLIPKTGKNLFCFFGSTIGNFKIEEVKNFMTLVGSKMKKGDSLLLGVDMIKDTNILEKAYNDSQQITADFNKNILNAVNEIIGSNFNSNDFEHIAFFNKEKQRIEMHLKAKKDMTITFNSYKEKIFIKKGEFIHTENSHKFDTNKINKMALWANLHIEKTLTDPNNWFSLVYFKKE